MDSLQSAKWSHIGAGVPQGSILGQVLRQLGEEGAMPPSPTFLLSKNFFIFLVCYVLLPFLF